MNSFFLLLGGGGASSVAEAGAAAGAGFAPASSVGSTLSSSAIADPHS
jgi:hypothetical protein